MAVGRDAEVATMACMLDGECCGERVPDMMKLQQKAIAKTLDEPPITAGEYLGFDMPRQLEPPEDYGLLVLLDQPNGLDNVSKHQRAGFTLWDLHRKRSGREHVLLPSCPECAVDHRRQ
jgi:hypothetical protein